MSVNLPVLHHPERQIGRRRFDFSRQAAVMAVVNRTPDSFHDRGANFALESAVNACVKAAELGADWIDIGGVPFSPDTPNISVDEELSRVMPVIEAVVQRSDIPISVDTVRAVVAKEAVAAGAAIVNDTSCLSDEQMARVVAESGATLIITHSLAEPHVHLRKPHYDNVIADISARLSERVNDALQAGVRPEQIVIDPGHDLNKNTLHTLELTRYFAQLCELGYPVLAAVSNKDFIGETLDRPREMRLAGSIASAMWCLAAGARIIRMHDVEASVDTVRMFEAIMGWREPAYQHHNV